MAQIEVTQNSNESENVSVFFSIVTPQIRQEEIIDPTISIGNGINRMIRFLVSYMKNASCNLNQSNEIQQAPWLWCDCYECILDILYMIHTCSMINLKPIHTNHSSVHLPNRSLCNVYIVYIYWNSCDTQKKSLYIHNNIFL